ncbi:phosphatase PAP2 family protein [Micromonospora eburnea]|nr:phosphatase PAP2 family protein [Micromonospora eburnea]
MTLSYACAVLAVLVPAALVPWLASRWVPVVAASRATQRLRVAVAGLTVAFGRLGAAVTVLLAGSALVVAVCWPLGEALSRLESRVDQPVFDYVHARQVEPWTEVTAFVTAIGDRYPLAWVTVLAAVALAVVRRGRRRWLPLVALPLQFIVEQYVQEILKRVVDRGHPPTDLGTYPSGGCARVLMTFGTVLVLTALTWRIPRQVRVGLVTALAVLVSVEGYTRVYAEKHWFTDVLGGWVFGTLLTGVMVLAVLVAEGRVLPATDRPVPAPREQVTASS